SINDELCAIERILQRASNRQVSLVVRGLRDGVGNAVLHEELVLFHHSFFLPFVDYVKSMPMGGGVGGYEKPGLLAAFTHAYDDNDMLRFWEAHHARLVGHKNLYVIDHGSQVSPRSVLHPDTNVVPLPRGQTDHANMARFCGHFQRFLLSQYSFVLHTDADELLVHEEGGKALLALLAGGGPDGVGLGGIIQPGHAFDVIHDVRAVSPAISAVVSSAEGPLLLSGEGPLVPGELISAQRSVMLPAQGIYKKPVLASIPASWLQGFHLVYEEQSVREEPGLWLMHLHAADFGLLLDKNRRWNAVRQTEQDRSISPQNRPGDKDSLRQWFAEAYADKRLTALPQQLRGKF
ncbi:MAG: glycosyltransferase family 2 protein, partial [Humidesulfovibrio sp.]|nr:glycosyltransferase family 2 protein [Humidesulfovibrio sp.]